MFSVDTANLRQAAGQLTAVSEKIKIDVVRAAPPPGPGGWASSTAASALAEAWAARVTELAGQAAEAAGKLQTTAGAYDDADRRSTGVFRRW
ncbi:type VII secretion target [Longispora albida]|uniref:type VII secretion target n=1 Tax=Longispora albida TaxID=203523 RepID=UPI0003785468|nr:type VII secretion target [Longispora albida]